MWEEFYYKGYPILIKSREGLITKISIVDSKDENQKEMPPIDSKKLDFGGFTDFEKQILQIVMKIPPGRVTTYNTVAKSAGRPGASRAVGNIMAKNPYPIIVPCHRVIKSDYHLGGYSWGKDIKRDILEKEGVMFYMGRVKKRYVL